MEKYNKYHESLNIDCGIKGGIIMNDEKRLETQEEEMDFIEKCVEEAPTSELSKNGIEVDGKGDEEEGK